VVGAVPILALFGQARMAISGMTGAVIVYAILSWVQTQWVVADVLQRMVAPLLIPIRRFLPLVGGVDLSPLALLVILQISAIVLGNLRAAALLAF
jgi:YggT family protein